MQSGKTMKKGVRRWISAILVLMIVLTSIIPSGLAAVAIDVPEDVNSGAANLSPLAAGDDLQELAGPKLTKISDNNYEMAYQSGNSYALSKSSAGAFVLETDVTIKQGNAATLMFGATTFDATNIGRGTDNTFFGLEFSGMSITKPSPSNCSKMAPAAWETTSSRAEPSPRPMLILRSRFLFA